MSKKLAKYVKRELQSGSSREQVKKTLVSAGWDEEEVEETLTKVIDGKSIDEMREGDTDEEEEIDLNIYEESDRHKLFLLVVVVVIMTLLVLGLFMAFTSFDPRMIF